MYYRSRPSPQTETAAPSTQAPAPTCDPGSNSAQLGEGEVVALHDQAGHVELGDSVSGEAVEIGGVMFTPGQVNALYDFIGGPANWEQFSDDEFEQMHALLVAGDESTDAWMKATHGLYAELSKANEDHFAPGEGGGPNFASGFVGLYGQALAAAQAALELGEGSAEQGEKMNEARALAYSAEHYLEDAFAAGHQVSADAVKAAVAPLVAGKLDAVSLAGKIAADAWARCSDRIQCYQYLQVTTWKPVDLAVFTALGTAQALKDPDVIADGVRKYVHEHLGERGVEVTSPAHPTPWVLAGDEAVAGNIGRSETEQAVAAALSDVRSTLELAAAGKDPTALAQEIFDRHCPVPTGDSQAMIDGIVAEATATPAALVSSCGWAAADTIEEIMDTVCNTQGLEWVIRRDPSVDEAFPADLWDVPEVDVPSAGSAQAPA